MSNALSATTANPQSAIRNPQSRRSPRPPSDRDLEIYKRVKIKGQEQWEIAQDLDLHRSRVSRIIKRVTSWLAAGGDPIDPLIRDHVARNNLAHADLKLRLARAIELASIALEFHPPLTMTRRRSHGMTEVWREETTRDLCKNNPPALRMLIDAIKTLHQIEQDDANAKRRRGTADSIGASPSDSDLLRAVFDFLCGWRSRAENSGVLPIADNIPALIASTLTTVLGLSADQVAGTLRVPSQTAPKEQLPAPNCHQTSKLLLSAPIPNDVNHDTPIPSESPAEKTVLAVASFNCPAL